MARYRKKAIEIEAVQWHEGLEDGWGLLWPSGNLTNLCDRKSEAENLRDTGFNYNIDEIRPSVVPIIRTLESCFFENGSARATAPTHIVSPGDWIITGIKGERYPCKPDVFQATYEPVP